MRKKNKEIMVKIFPSFDTANQAEHKRWARMSPKQRWDEMAILQNRVWGVNWSHGKIKRTASYEKIQWLK